MVSEVVKMLQVPEGTIFRWIKQGDIPYIEKKGEYFFNASTIITWADAKNILLNKNQFKECFLNLHSSIIIDLNYKFKQIDYFLMKHLSFFFVTLTYLE